MSGLCGAGVLRKARNRADPSGAPCCCLLIDVELELGSLLNKQARSVFELDLLRCPIRVSLSSNSDGRSVQVQVSVRPELELKSLV